jgi:anti-sigma factor RsiW
MKACLEVASGLADPARSEVASHLATCPSCRATAAALEVVRGVRNEAPDLWRRVQARLQQRDEVIVRVPRVGWQVAAAVVAVSATAALAPEPGRLLAVLLGMM